MVLEPNRLFFALWPADGVRDTCAQAARQLKARLQPGGYLIRPERFHVTLLFLGDAVPPQQEAAAVQAASLLRLAPFTMQLDQAGSFRNRSIPWWLAPRMVPAEAQTLHEALREHMRGAGVAYDRMRFAPHLTILRDAQRSLAPTPISPIEWPVAGFVLIRSRLQAQPVEYEIVGRWKLQATLSKRTASAQLNLWETDAS
jgi:2'-5' RNA ligase